MLRIRRDVGSGKPLRLREGVHRQLRDREWIFSRAEKEMIFLVHASGAYGVVVRSEDVDWENVN
jgi:hypothetical protein